jgi:hypothetical protein
MVCFLSAGLPSPLPTSVMVAALAAARREVVAHQARNESLGSWLASEVRMRGVRENAAVLAVLELPARRAEVAAAYRREHPDRATTLDAVMAILTRSP